MKTTLALTCKQVSANRWYKHRQTKTSTQTWKHAVYKQRYAAT